MISDERDPLTGVHSISKFIDDVMGGHVQKLMVVAIVNIKQIMDYFGLNEGDASLKKISEALSGAYGDRVYRISNARFVVRDPDLSRIFDAPHAFSQREAVACLMVRVDGQVPSSVEVKNGKELIRTLDAVRMDDLKEGDLYIKLPAPPGGTSKGK